MTLIRTLFVVALTFAFVSKASADNSPMYFGLGIADYEFEGSPITMDGYYLNYGIDIGNYFAIEGIIANSSQYENAAASLTSEIDYYGALYGRFNLRYDHVTLYVMAGYATVSTTTTVSGTAFETEDSGVTYAVGIDLYGTQNTALTIRYYDYLDEDIHATGINIGLNFYFDVPRIHKRY